VKVVFKPVLKSSEEIFSICQEANNTKHCIASLPGCILFLRQMWIGGWEDLQKPLMHLHTQFNRDIPWKEIDIGLYEPESIGTWRQEFGYIMTR